jgi:hypothetical protein
MYQIIKVIAIINNKEVRMEGRKIKITNQMAELNK